MIQSMTTFARLSDQGDWGMATWEIRVVNHRYFDCALKMPEAFRQVEANIRLQLQKQLHRGRVECSLRFDHGEQGESNLVLNKELVKKLVDAVSEIKTYLPMSTIDPMRILSWPQVLQTAEEDPGLAQDMVLQLFEKSLAELVVTRKREGLALAKVMQDKLQEAIISSCKNKYNKSDINSLDLVTPASPAIYPLINSFLTSEFEFKIKLGTLFVSAFFPITSGNSAANFK